jgi:Asp-tRNA(Asn)/Glu-tRNA(Gln) amidotransferase A subunit family amidase
MTRQPALTVPCGFTEAGLPAGLQIVGPRYGDALVMAAGYAFQKAFSLLDRWPEAGKAAKNGQNSSQTAVGSTPEK